ncbi:signal peptidase II [bacterium]|nr:signal peptidase II [bacterium]
MNTTIGKYLFFIASFAFWMFLALFTSRLIVDNLTSGHHYSNAVFSLHYLKNSGAAFSLLQNAREFLIIVSIVATTFLFTYVHNHVRSINMISVSFIALLSAGIMSNCHERIVLGYVRDYIHLNFMSFPIFNVADIFITIGVIALVAILLFYKGR